MSFEPRDYLRHILIEADYLLDRSADLTQSRARLAERLLESLENLTPEENARI
ncbi:MAG: hypothetical protein U0P82_20175 [Vicinamibacterales bacterium]